LTALFELLQQQKIKPIVAQRFPLSEARQAQELLGKGGVIGKIVLVPNGSSCATSMTLLISESVNPTVFAFRMKSM
jgi:NADPH2:quinone reductase